MAMNLDMLFDPIMVSPERKRWVWEFGGSYFDIPIQNFLGWFLVGFTISLLIRLYDMRTGRSVPLGGRLVHYLPSGLYFLMFALFALLSLIDGYPQYALIGFAEWCPLCSWRPSGPVSRSGPNLSTKFGRQENRYQGWRSASLWNRQRPLIRAPEKRRSTS